MNNQQMTMAEIIRERDKLVNDKNGKEYLYRNRMKPNRTNAKELEEYLAAKNALEEFDAQKFVVVVDDEVPVPAPFRLEMPDMFKVSERLMFQAGNYVSVCIAIVVSGQIRTVLMVEPIRRSKKFYVSLPADSYNFALASLPKYDTLYEAVEAAVAWVNSAPDGYTFEAFK